MRSTSVRPATTTRNGKGTFYPDDLPAKRDVRVLRRTIPHRRDQLHVLPDADAEDHEGAGSIRRRRAFTYTLKAPRRITHEKRLINVEPTSRLSARPRACSVRIWRRCCFSCRRPCVPTSAGSTTFLEALPTDIRAAFEFRHDSWLTDEVYDLLRRYGVALCIADFGDKTTPIVATARHGYFRLRDEGYQPADLERVGRNRRRARSRLGRRVRVLQARR